MDSKYFNKKCENSKGFFIDTTDTSSFKNSIENDKFLSLRPLNIPSDTFCLRIEHSKNDTLYVFEYSIYQLTQNFKVFRFPIKHNYEIMFDENKEELGKFTTVYNSSGVKNSFFNVLEKNDILNLPDCNSIPGYYISESFGDYYNIQYSNKCMYRCLAYGDPYKNSKNIKVAKNLTNFLDYLKKEFDFK